MKIIKPSVQLLWLTPYAEQVIEIAGRTCYKSEELITEDSSSAFIKRILKQGHESVIEHASASFRIICDRGVSHELVRHRIASYSQESTRYCDYSKDKFRKEITVIEPPDLTPEQKDSWETGARRAEIYYHILIARGCTPQIARSVLPNCLKTEIVVTCNLREWRHILRLRTSDKAHSQIKEVCLMILESLKDLCPSVFIDFYL